MEYGLIGEKLGHSYSKQIHSCLGGYDYELKEIKREDLEAFIKERDFKGINVTIPYKEAVIPLLDEVDPAALSIGAVNTVVNHNGKLKGYNTDAFGLKALILKKKIDLKGKKVLILGTGGTSNTSYHVAKELGAAQILKVSRTGKNGALTYEEAYDKHTDADVIINTTPLGMYPATDAVPIEIDKFPKLSGLVDVIYNPLRTKLVIEAENKGINSTSALFMLSGQAVYAMKYFLGEECDEEALTEKAYHDTVSGIMNICLIGMPSSGKSTVGKKLALKLGMRFIDTDELIKERIGMSIPEYFEKYGEKEFRKVESSVIKDLENEHKAVISTGGGAVLDQTNIINLKKNGVVVFLDRDLEKLTATADRPLSSDIERLKRLYEERYDKYVRAADIHVYNNRSFKETIKAITDRVNNRI